MKKITKGKISKAGADIMDRKVITSPPRTKGSSAASLPSKPAMEAYSFSEPCQSGTMIPAPMLSDATATTSINPVMIAGA
ncbi:hypothetical protein JCM17845_28450 [Iodidimonas gelatinilytica]|uniref:Uncharacterized protein n=1 Tax=Iodidimonas gelatinilytica TaxID=1236966 RepID=A0A5A7N1S4_9PROT|nr:hypothetical protein JCM17845_28450 [Iodidimonas gelatinilytica]